MTQYLMNSISKPYRVDSNSKEGGILLYITEGIISKSIPDSLNSNNLEYLLVETKLGKNEMTSSFLLQFS